MPTGSPSVQPPPRSAAEPAPPPPPGPPFALFITLITTPKEKGARFSPS